MAKERITEEKIIKRRKPHNRELSKDAPGEVKSSLSGLQQAVGNRAVQRLLAQRSDTGSFELDDETASRINQQRGGGQTLDSTVQANMGAATGHDFSQVKVHTGQDAHSLSEELGAKAFTTGQDIFFREGAYNPGSSGGQELLAHELAHVVQQSSGQVSGGSKMTVNAPGDAFEQEADALARQTGTQASAAEVQRQAAAEEDDIQEQPADEEQDLMRQELDEDEVHRQEVPEEDEQV